MPCDCPTKSNPSVKHGVALLLLIVASCFGCGSLKNDVPLEASMVAQNTGRVQGYVYSTPGGTLRLGAAHAGLLPLQGAAATVSGTAITSTTDENGYYLLQGVPVGARTIVISKPGYQGITRTVSIVLDTTITATSAMSEESVLAPESNGALTITSTPASATIFLDAVGTALQTPQTFENLCAGAHSVFVTLDGYATATAQTVEVVEGATGSVSFTLSRFTCYSDTDCDDGNAFTRDECAQAGTENSSCSHGAIACVADSDCDDSNPRTADLCNNPSSTAAACSHTTIPLTCTDTNMELRSSKYFFMSDFMPCYTGPPDYARWTWLDRNPATGAPHASVFTPLMGLYEGRDHNVIMAQLMEMRAAGLNSVTINWYGRANVTDEITELFIQGIESMPCPMGFMLMTDGEPYRWGYEFADPARKDLFIADMLYIANRYMTRPQYLKLDGRPVILHFWKPFDDGKNVPNPIMDLTIPVAWWEEVHQQILDEVGIDFAFVPYNHNDYVGHSDGVMGWFQVTENDPDDYGAGYYNWFMPWTKWLRTDVPAVPMDFYVLPTILPGFDDSGVYAWSADPTRKRVINHVINGQKTIDITYGHIKSFNTANPAFAANAIAVATFNDWPEGTQIEPSIEFGMNDLKDTARLAQDFGVQHVPQLSDSQWNALQTYVDNFDSLTSEQKTSSEYLFLNENFIGFEQAVNSYFP